jgi:hypothetical protein
VRALQIAQVLESVADGGKPAGDNLQWAERRVALGLAASQCLAPTALARSGMKKIGIQPSAISAARSTLLSAKEAR